MIRASEYVSLGHPDKIADYISQYLLDRYIEKDPDTRYAVEVQIKGYHITLGGEVSSAYKMDAEEIRSHVRDAVNEIGYNREYLAKWGFENTICGTLLDINIFISQQSPDIAQGVLSGNRGWGDQGIFFGMATHSKDTFGMPEDHTIAKRLCHDLFNSGIGGLDIKTQVVFRDNRLDKVIVAIPLLEETPVKTVEQFIHACLEGQYKVIVNGTGRYVQHASIADCGTTGRKLAVDFYGGNCIIGGGSPWTKDGTKADLTLNLTARRIAKEYAAKCHCDVFVSLACCIGKQEVDVLVKDGENNILLEGQMDMNPEELRKAYRLDTPIYASMCRCGLFGEYQQDKAWEQNSFNIK